MPYQDHFLLSFVDVKADVYKRQVHLYYLYAYNIIDTWYILIIYFVSKRNEEAKQVVIVKTKTATLYKIPRTGRKEKKSTNRLTTWRYVK